MGSYLEVSANISFTIYVSGLPELIIPNLHSFYHVNHSYELVCNSYSYPVSSVWWSWIPCDIKKPASCFTQSQSKNEYFFNDDLHWKNVSKNIDGKYDESAIYINANNKAIVHLNDISKR